MLLKSGADANLAMADGRTPIHIASESGNIGVIRLLLENDADILATDEDGETALHKACKMCNFNVLQCLIDFARANKPESFKNYVNGVNVKVGKHVTLSHYLFTFHCPGGISTPLHFYSTTQLQQSKGKSNLSVGNTSPQCLKLVNFINDFFVPPPPPCIQLWRKGVLSLLL